MVFIPGTRIPIPGTQPTIPGTNIPRDSGPAVGRTSEGNVIVRTPSGGTRISGGSSGGSPSKSQTFVIRTAPTGQLYYDSGGQSVLVSGDSIVQKLQEQSVTPKQFKDSVEKVRQQYLAQGYTPQEVTVILAGRVPSVAQQIQSQPQASQQGQLSMDWFYRKQQLDVLREAGVQEGAYKFKVDNLEKKIGSYEEQVKIFEEKFAGKQLTQAQYNVAVQEQARLEKERASIQSDISSVTKMGFELQEKYEDYNKRLAGSQTASLVQRQYEQSLSGVRTVLSTTDSPLKQAKIVGLEPAKLTSIRDRPRGEKLETMTTGELISKGALGTALTLEQQASQPFQKGRGLDIVEGIKSVGLGIASVPAQAGQLLGSRFQDVYSPGTKVGIKEIEDKPFVFKSGTGKIISDAEVYSPTKAGQLFKEQFRRDPLGTIGDVGLKIAMFTPVGRISLSKLGSAFVKRSDLLKPQVSFPKYSKFVETRGVSGGEQVIMGKGKLVYQETTRLAKALGKKPVTKTLDIGYEFKLKELYDVSGKMAPKFPRGSPQTLSGYIPEKRLLDLVTQQKEVTQILRGRIGYTGEGIIRISGKGMPTADYRLVSETTGAFGKQVRVRVAPIGLEQSQVVSQFKLVTTGDSGLTGGKVASVSRPIESKAVAESLRVRVEQTTGQLLKVKKDGFVDRFVQKIRVEAGPKFKIKGLAVEGTGRGPFDYGKVPVVDVKSSSISLSSNGDTLVQQLQKSASVSKPVSASVGRTTAVSDVGQTAKKYLDVYGLQSALKPLSASKLSGLSASGTLITMPRINVGTIPSPGQVFVEQPSINVGQVSVPVQSISVKPVVQTGFVEVQKVQQPQLLKVPAKLSVGTITKTVTDTSIKSVEKIVTPQAIKQITSQKVVQLQKTKLQELLKVQKASIVSPRVTPMPKIPIFPVPIVFPSLKFGPVGFSRQRLPMVSEAYKVVTRVGGREKVLSVGVPKNIAIKVGSRFVGETPARSFKIVKVGLTRKRDIPLDFRSEQFRKPVPFGRVAREGFKFVEKSKFAIDTIGEKEGIPGKAKRLRKLGKKGLPKIPKRLI